MRRLNGIYRHAVTEKYRRGHDQHRRVDQPRAIHCQKNVQQFHPPVMMLFAVGRLAARQHERGMQINNVRHHGGAQHRNGDVDRRRLHVRNNDPLRDFAPVRLAQEHFVRVREADHGDEAHNDAFQPLKTGLLEHQNEHHDDAGQYCRGKHSNAEKKIEPERRAQEFSEIGGHRGNFRGKPQSERHPLRELRPAIFGQRLSRRDSQLRGEILHQDRHRIRPQQHPEKLIAEPRAAFDVRRKITGVHVRDGSDEGGSNEPPSFTRPAGNTSLGPHRSRRRIRESP